MAGKYAFDRNYYVSRAQGAYNGSAARKIDEYDEFDEEYDEFAEFVEPETEYEEEEIVVKTPARRRSQDVIIEKQPEIRERYRIKNDTFAAVIFTIAIAMILICSFKYLEVLSDITETDKMITKAEMKLDDVRALNESLSSSLDVEIDRDYIYTVAVAKLGMVYPNQNQVISYEPVYEGYVRQASTIPAK